MFITSSTVCRPIVLVTTVKIIKNTTFVFKINKIIQTTLFICHNNSYNVLQCQPVERKLPSLNINLPIPINSFKHLIKLCTKNCFLFLIILIMNKLAVYQWIVPLLLFWLIFLWNILNLLHHSLNEYTIIWYRYVDNIFAIIGTTSNLFFRAFNICSNELIDDEIDHLYKTFKDLGYSIIILILHIIKQRIYILLNPLMNKNLIITLIFI